MRKSFGIFISAVTLASIAALAVSCTTREMNSAPKSTGTPSPPGTGVPIPGFETMGSPQARRKAEVVARFGSPADEEKFHNGRYTLLAYPVSGWNEKLLILFAREELLGFSRE